MSNSHHLAVSHRQSVFYLLSLGPNYKKKSQVHRMTQKKKPMSAKRPKVPYVC